MRTHQCRNLWRSIAAGLSALLAGATWAAAVDGSGRGDKDAAAATDRLRGALAHVSSVSFYFYSSTGKYSLSAEKLRSGSSVFVRRGCGGNCENFMREVLEHLEAARGTDCPQGQENILIDVGPLSVVYSNSGRTIKFDGRCFFNSENVAEILKADGFFFH